MDQLRYLDQIIVGLFVIRLYVHFQNLVDYYNEKMQHKLHRNTMGQYKTSQRYKMEYILKEYKLTDIPLFNLEYSFIVGFEDFLRSYVPKSGQSKIGNNTAMKHIKRLRRMVTLAYRMKWMERDPFVNFKMKIEKKERGFLTDFELLSIEDLSSSIERLMVVKDLFVFSCYTGISYVDIVQLNEDNIVIYVYLTPISTLDLIELTEPECNCKEFIQINYQSIVDYLIEPALNQNISARTQNILTEYLKSLSQPSINEEADGHKQELIMALGNEERKLLSSFWEKNQKLILASLYAISSDPEQEKDTRDSIREALDSLSSDKDRSTYNIKYNGEIFSSNFKKSDIGLQTINLLKAKGLIDDNIIKYLRKDKSCSFLLLKKKEEFTETEIKYRKYRTNDSPELIYNGEEFYVARNWGIGNIHKLINKFTDKFPGLEYETN